MSLDDRLEALTRNLELVTLGHTDHDARLAAAEERQAAADERQAAAEERQAAANERHAREMAEIRGILRRAIRLGVQEARNERRRRSELDEKITQLSAAQLITEEKLQKFIQSLERGGNGHQ